MAEYKDSKSKDNDVGPRATDNAGKRAVTVSHDAGCAAPFLALKEIEAAWNKAAESWDADFLAKLYTQDALLFGGRPGHCVGWREIYDYFESYNNIILSANLDLYDQQVVSLSPDIFLAQGYGRFSFLLGENKKTESIFRTTLLMCRKKDWKIRQHHFSEIPKSPPIGRDDA